MMQHSYQYDQCRTDVLDLMNGGSEERFREFFRTYGADLREVLDDLALMGRPDDPANVSALEKELTETEERVEELEATMRRLIDEVDAAADDLFEDTPDFAAVSKKLAKATEKAEAVLP